MHLSDGNVSETALLAADPDHSTGLRLPRWLLFLGFWTLLVLIYSTRTGRSIRYEWVPLSWFDSLRIAAAQWYSWGLLAVAIYWVNRWLPLKKDAFALRLLCHAPLSLAFTVVYTYLNYGMAELLGAPLDESWMGESLLETATRAIYRLGMFVYWAITTFYLAMEYQGDLRRRAVRAAEVERLLSEARLLALRAQLNPHFLFNALNSISAYLESAPGKARMMIEQLGDLLRLSLERASEQEIPLEDELGFIRRYIDLQLVRFADRLDVQVRVNAGLDNAAIPTFLLQPLVENAFRHGVADLTTAGVVELAVWRSGDRLHVRVRDNGRGLPPGWTLEQNMGRGLGTTRARLEQLYGTGAYTFEVGPDKDGGTRVDISLPYRSM